MTQKEKAVELLQCLKISQVFVDRFVNEDKVTLFNVFSCCDISKFEVVKEKIKEIERDHHCIVYAVTHNFFMFGECFSFLMVPVYEEDWQYLLQRLDRNTFSVMAYVWNRSKECCSEFGSVIINSFFGGIARVG